MPGRVSGAVAVALLCTVAAPLAAQRTLEIQRFHSDILVRRNGTLAITETIEVHFTGSWNGLLRSVPVEYDTGYGTNYTLRLELESATDESGGELRIESERAGRSRIFRVWVPGATDATRTVVLRYRVANGLRFFDEHDELYWNVTGDESEFPIASASARVLLPEQASGIRAAAYTGAYGSRESDARITQVANSVEFRTLSPLGFREGLTIVVGWNPGAVTRPSKFDRVKHVLLSNIVLAVPLLAFGVMLTLWRRHGRDPRLRPIAPQYEPPAHLTPAEVGTLVDATPDMRDVTATIVDLAVRGYLTIEETREEQLFGLFSSQDYAFHTRKPRAEWSALKPHERELLEALFRGGRDTVRSSQLENSFYQDLPGITRHLRAALVEDGHYLHHPNTVRGAFAAIGVAAGALVALGGGLLAGRVLGQGGGAAVIAGVLTAAVVIGFGMAMPARTVRGTRTLESLLGFEEFLRRVESDRFERVIKTPELFEKYLPFAMALGVEKNWSTAFDEIYATPPDWYRGASPHGFRCHAFAGNLGRMSTVTAGAMQSAPRSSSSSSGFGGGGGGGFSGGGFGGGGVGGF
jgi:hypothetical protein